MAVYKVIAGCSQQSDLKYVDNNVEDSPAAETTQ